MKKKKSLIEIKEKIAKQIMENNRELRKDLNSL